MQQYTAKDLGFYVPVFNDGIKLLEYLGKGSSSCVYRRVVCTGNAASFCSISCPEMSETSLLSQINVSPEAKSAPFARPMPGMPRTGRMTCTSQLFSNITLSKMG